MKNTSKQNNKKKSITSAPEVILVVGTFFLSVLIVNKQTKRIDGTADLKEPKISVTATETGNTAVNDSLLDILRENGIDTSELEESGDTDIGGKILGSALPAKQYRTLHDAESAFGYYLGLHNHLDSLTEYELVDMYIINGNIMQAVYENADETRTITVKTSKEKSVDELADVYTRYSHEVEKTYSGISVTFSGEEDDMVNLVKLSYSGKAYTIYSASGLGVEDAEDLTKELIKNLLLIQFSSKE